MESLGTRTRARTRQMPLTRVRDHFNFATERTTSPRVYVYGTHTTRCIYHHYCIINSQEREGEKELGDYSEIMLKGISKGGRSRLQVVLTSCHTRPSKRQAEYSSRLLVRY